MRSSILPRLLPGLLAGLLLACGRSGEDRDFDLITVSVEPAAATVTAREGRVFTAVLTHASNPAVTWSVQEGTPGGSITPSGLYTAPPAAGTYHVVATSVENTRKRATATVSVVLAPEILGFTVSDAQIAPGSPVTLVPHFVHGEGRIEPGVGPVSSGQQVTLSPTASTTYTLTVTNAAGTQAMQSLTVTLVPPPAIQDFAASTTLVTEGQAVLLTPRFSGGEGNILPGIGVVQSGLAYEVRPATGTTYVLTVRNALGQTQTASVRVEVVPVPAIQSFTATPTTVNAGESVALRPVFSGGSGLVTPGLGAVQSGVSYAVVPAGSTTYLLTVTGPTGQQLQASVQVNVRARGGFLPTGVMGLARKDHQATLLADGTVLVTGGVSAEEGSGQPLIPLDMAERYDPVSGRFTPVGLMRQRRTHHAAVRLGDGRVFLCGGNDQWSPSVPSTPISATASAEIFDPATLQFTPVAGSMSVPRRNHSATLLPDGRVLIAGGTTGAEKNHGVIQASAEIFDPALGTFTPTITPMLTPRLGHRALGLPGGPVLLLGGVGYTTEGVAFGIASAEIAAGLPPTFLGTPTSMSTPRGYPALVGLADGRLLVAGGLGIQGTWILQAELFDPIGRTFSPSLPLASAIPEPVAAPLPGGRILVVGRGAANILDMTQGQTQVVSTAGVPATGGLTATAVAGGRVLVLSLEGAVLFDPTLP